ncbi:hypothetical protein M413DRAFT_447137 [Hebeloma cylindrosporum]|uniref:Uncharacterized protein n=1 Tax=Hebeloma cylindrosporum TaxID=76867 RepID=A0A0C3C624_HEBCY|nr:hypothetical protein M413DRAFT_447137 [Hebeloma cylindrosporum h7]
MNTDTPLLSLKKASMKLGQVAKEDPDRAMVLPLLKAIEDFNDRIIPNFSTVEKQKQEIERLRSELHRSHRERDLMQTKLRKAESLQTEVVSLRNALSESEANTQEAIRLAEAAKDDLGKLHETSGQSQRRAVELDQENKRFKDMLERHTSIGRVQKDKNRKLQKQLAAMREERAEAERATMSDALTHEYDGDFSGHEASRPQSSFHIVSPSPSRAARRSFHDENDISLDFAGIAPPTFPSDWKIEPGVLRKRTVNGTLVGTQRRVGGVFPISLDRKGHPTKAVQLGPKSIVHVSR